LKELGESGQTETLVKPDSNVVKDFDVVPNTDNIIVEKNPSVETEESRNIVENVLKSVKEPDSVPKSDVVPDAKASLDQQDCHPDNIAELCSDSGFSSDNTSKKGTKGGKVDNDVVAEDTIEKSQSEESEKTGTD
jgi:hypothetical protein